MGGVNLTQIGHAHSQVSTHLKYCIFKKEKEKEKEKSSARELLSVYLVHQLEQVKSCARELICVPCASISVKIKNKICWRNKKTKSICYTTNIHTFKDCPSSSDECSGFVSILQGRLWGSISPQGEYLAASGELPCGFELCSRSGPFSGLAARLFFR